ncbi:DUF3168 domain-containing protein [Ectobacillus ponti]|uniref:DUF3168 domain-containing protein n=1 Tax=Ectobacillus ponti TaxID=2961894 RepID=A0AA42BQS1_9BACI|nr:DUF3168 domain-containing protein [Ectobacillus ponti]MCP8970570.1 DUF3168 domain-containing protein [Ectobacillus ponti]
MIALDVIQKAIFQKLSTTGNITSFCGVYDLIPENASFPYVRVGDDRAVPWETKSFDGHQVTSTIHIWSAYKGKKEVKNIISLVDNAIRAGLTLDAGYTMDFWRLSSANILEDDRYQHGVLTYTFRIVQR